MQEIGHGSWDLLHVGAWCSFGKHCEVDVMLPSTKLHRVQTLASRPCVRLLVIFNLGGSHGSE